MSDVTVALHDFDSAVRRGYDRLFAGEPDKSPTMLDWRFRANPHGAAKFALATAGDDTLGMIALVPTRLVNSGGDELGFQAIDTAVDPSCRGQGLFVKLGQCAQDRLGGELLWGFPNANAAPGWYGRLGWTNFGQVPLLMRPLRSSFLLGRLHPRLRPIDWPIVANLPARGTVYADGAALEANFDPLWQRTAPDFGVAVDRSGTWMRWRLFDKPGADYRCVGVTAASGALEAFVATRVADKHNARLCYVMEALGLPRCTAELANLLRSELSRAARDGAEAALAWCPATAPNYRAYRNAGFFPVPARMRPIEINFGARALRPAMQPAVAAAANWYVSFLDSDTN